MITTECLTRCQLAIFSSEWAAESALSLYGVDRSKVKVVSYGANIESAPTFQEVTTIIKKRVKDKIKLLFLAKSWERKGGDIAVAIASELHAGGYAVELNIVGYMPKIPSVPSYIKRLGFISKQTPAGKARLDQLFNESHFLLLPSRADACPMVFAESNAHGLPCLTSYVGGIASAIKDNINGMTFALDAPLITYCSYIVNLLRERSRYEELAISSYNEYQTRLNWQSATEHVTKLIAAL
jgi:glycosyltransferase involved in cell wall biosynthesis